MGFVADDVYQDHDEIMNFGKDSYAAMTYYVHDFGTADHPNIPQLTEINWMNTWKIIAIWLQILLVKNLMVPLTLTLTLVWLNQATAIS